MIPALCALLTLTAASVQANTAGNSAAITHLMQARGTSQIFGSCSRQQVELLFGEYPSRCNTAYSRLRTVLDDSNPDANTIREIYSAICSEDCKLPVVGFREDCQVRELTDPILKACEENSVQDLCILGLYTNNGTEAALNCRSAVATGTCSEDCRRSIQQLQADLGCCVNTLFNATTFGYELLNVADMQLWQLCGVETPDFCRPSFLSFTGGANSPTYVFSILVTLAFTTAYLLFL